MSKTIIEFRYINTIDITNQHLVVFGDTEGVLYQVSVAQLKTLLGSSGSGGGGITHLKLRVNANGQGTPDSTFDYYVAAGSSIVCPELSGKRLNYVIHNAAIYQDFNSPSLVSQSGTTVHFDIGLKVGDYLIISYQ